MTNKTITAKGINIRTTLGIEAYRHEQEHIKHGDLDSSLPVSTLEANR